MLDHVGITVSDFERSRTFYQRALAPLGVSVQMEVTEAQSGGYRGLGFGVSGKPSFWVGWSPQGAASGPVHLAFAAADRAGVDAFYAAAMAAGGRDNGGPGLRPHYHPNYYGAFVFDLDGNNVEAVSHRPE